MTSTDCKPWCRHKCPECRMGLGSHLYCDPQCYGYDPDARYVPEPPLDDERPFFFAHRNAMSILDWPYATIRYDKRDGLWCVVVLSQRGTFKRYATTWDWAMRHAHDVLTWLQAGDKAELWAIYSEAADRRTVREEKLRGEHAKG